MSQALPFAPFNAYPRLLHDVPSPCLSTHAPVVMALFVDNCDAAPQGRA